MVMKGSISEGCRYHGVVVEGRNSCGCFRECKRRGATDLFSEEDFVIEGRLSRDLGGRAGEGEVRTGKRDLREAWKGEWKEMVRVRWKVACQKTWRVGHVAGAVLWE